MKYALATFMLTSLLMAGVAHADPADNDKDQTYELPTIVHGKTSMTKAMQTGSTFSFKLFQVDEPEKPQPYSYPEPSLNHR